MVTISKTGGPGLRFENEVVRLEVNDAGGVSEGDCLILELVDGAYSKEAKSTAASSEQTPNRLIGIAMEDGVNGQKVRVGLRGVFTALCSYYVVVGLGVRVANAAPAFGSVPTNPSAGDGSVYNKIIGIALETADKEAVGSGNYLIKILFDGITGFACTVGTVEE